MTAAEARKPDVTLVGDVMPGRGVGASLVRFGPDKAAAWLKSLLPGRLVIGNLECPLCDAHPSSDFKADGSPNLRASPSVAVWLRRAGFTAFCLANNHVLDCGPDGLAQTIEHLHRAGIRTAGAGGNLYEALAPAVMSCDGRQVALLAFGNGPAAGRKTAGVAPVNSECLARALRQVRGSADAVVVMVHAGLEFLEYPESYVRRFADEAVDGGADVVVGSHPHCIRGLKRSARGVILYGLGDFLADTTDERLLASHLARTALTRLGFEATGARHCEQALACDVFLAGARRIECKLRAVIAGRDFIPRAATRHERYEVLGRMRQLSRPVRRPEDGHWLNVEKIEKAYAKAYCRRGLKGWLTLPFRLRRRHVARLARRLGSDPGGSNR